MIKQNIAKLLDAEMERKDFLKLIGLGAVAAVGVSSIVKAMSQQTSQNGSKSMSQSSAGYGSSPYGGTKSPTA